MQRSIYLAKLIGPIMLVVGLAMLVNGDDAVASVLGAMAAACECEVDGNAPITTEAMHRKIDLVEKHVNFG